VPPCNPHKKNENSYTIKVFVPYKRGGGVRVAGLVLGNYNSGWEKLFENSIEVMKKMRRFLFVTDGDTSILGGLKDKVKVIIQRCLWHIPYQAKYVLWQDGVKHKGSEWLHVVSALMEICACQKTIESKKQRLEEVMRYCREKV